MSIFFAIFSWFSGLFAGQPQPNQGPGISIIKVERINLNPRTVVALEDTSFEAPK